MPGLPTTISCPLCAWTYVIKPVDPRIGPGTLASVFGVGTMQHQAILQQAAEIEAALKTHVESHSVQEWVTKVAALMAEIEQLKIEINKRFA